MPQIKSILDAYINANVILAFAFLTWCLLRFLLSLGQHRRSYTLQLRLTEGLIIVALISPALSAAVMWLNTLFFPNQTLNAADIAVSQFLDGRLDIRAVEFEGILRARKSFLIDLAYMQTPWAKAIVATLLAGFIFGLGRIFFNAVRLNRLISRSYLWRRFGRLDLRFSDTVSVPFSTRGVTRRYVVLPTIMLDDPSHMRIALAHELQHMRRWDTEWELALVLLQPIFFWNPAFHLWKRKVEQLRELSCDQELIQRNRIEPRAYADCLLDVCRNGIALRGGWHPVTPSVPFLALGRGMAGRRNARNLRHRITEISAVRRAEVPRWSAMMWALLSVAALAVGISTSAIQHPGDWSQDRLMVSSIANLERMEQRNAAVLSLSNY